MGQGTLEIVIRGYLSLVNSQSPAKSGLVADAWGMLRKSRSTTAMVRPLRFQEPVDPEEKGTAITGVILLVVNTMG